MDPDFDVKFQSTLSVRRATRVIKPLVQVILISIHALREESDHHGGNHRLNERISIHALREESDFNVSFCVILVDISIHALREESDETIAWDGLLRQISIHALREESDRRANLREIRDQYFNPRSP